jgi:hypothetical protein
MSAGSEVMAVRSFLLLTFFVVMLAVQETSGSTIKLPPPGHVTQAWRLPTGGWALNPIRNSLPHPQDERLLCQNGFPKQTEKPFYPYLCDAEGLLPQTCMYMLCSFTACIGVAVIDVLCLLFFSFSITLQK